jgi:hypothetical protein
MEYFMDRYRTGRKLKTTRILPALLIAAIFASLSASSSAQPAAQPAPPQNAGSAPQAISGLLQPALDTVSRTLDGVHIDKWKKGSIRDEASVNIDSIRKDLRTNIPALLQEADAGPGTVGKLLPISNHVDALYDVLLRVSEASRVSGPDDQAAALQQALLSLSNARLALNDRMQGSADALEKQVADLRATIQQQAAQRAAAPVPVALPCIPPPTKKPAAKTHKPAAKPATTPATTTTTTPAKPGPPK